MKRALRLAVILSALAAVVVFAYQSHQATAQIRAGDSFVPGNFYLGGTILGYNGATAVGGGVPLEVYNTVPAAGTASIAATTMFTPAVAGTYRMSFYVTQTVAGTSCTGNTTVQVNAIFQDPNAAAAQTVAIPLFTVTTNGTIGQVPLTSGPMSYTFRSKASAAVQYSTTYTLGTACSPGPTVQVFPVLEQL